MHFDGFLRNVFYSFQNLGEALQIFYKENPEGSLEFFAHLAGSFRMCKLPVFE